MKTNQFTQSNRVISMAKNSGFTLVEVLIAIVILAIGLLGTASMQANGVRVNHSAYLRSQATVLAYEIIDKMRSNRDRNSSFLGVLANYQTNFPDTISGPLDCLSVVCSETQIIDFDVDQWKNSLTVLPSGEGAISVSANGDVIIAQVTVRWDDTRGAETPKTFTTQTRL